MTFRAILSMSDDELLRALTSCRTSLPSCPDHVPACEFCPIKQKCGCGLPLLTWVVLNIEYSRRRRAVK